MAVFYKIYQNKNKKSSANGKFFARPVYTSTVTTDEIAERVQEKCALHISDVVGCIKALVTEIKICIQNSERVNLVGLGTFKMSFSTRGADKKEDFSAGNIKRMRVLFMPTTKVDRSTGAHTRALTIGTRVKEWAPEQTGTTQGGTSTPGGGTGSQTGGNTGSQTGGSSSGSEEDTGGSHENI